MASIESTRQALEEDKKTRTEIERRHGKTCEQLFEEREKRVKDAIELREPDRVPVSVPLTLLPASYAGIPKAAAFYDAAVWKDAVKRTVLYLDPDMYWALTRANGGRVLEALDPSHLKWPGGVLPEDVSHQAIEQEYMKEDEYDLFLDDPTDYTLRYLLPRAFGALLPLVKLPLVSGNFNQFANITPIFATDEFEQVGKALRKAGQEQRKWGQIMDSVEDELANLGFPPFSYGGGAGGASFDAISDYYRGMRGAMTDMYRCPDKLMAACDKILSMRIKRATPADPKKRGNPKRSVFALHRGAEGFMSNEQFKTFYWPGLKKAMLTTISLDYVPMAFCEGRYLSRLEYFLELPKGKAICYLDQTDMYQAKEILKDRVCLMGNIPPALLQIGSTEEVEEYCRKLIKVCGKGGGFILTSATSAIDEAKPANVKAMVDSARKFSVN